MKLYRKFHSMNQYKKRTLVISILFLLVFFVLLSKQFLSRYGLAGSNGEYQGPSLSLFLPQMFFEGGAKPVIGIYMYVTANWTITIDNFHESWDFITIALPSFCQEASPEYSYDVNIIYHPSDLLMNRGDFQEKVIREFEKRISCNCSTEVQDSVNLYFYTSDHRRDRIGWAIGEKVWEDYVGQVEFFYVKSPGTPFPAGWAVTFVRELKSKSPSYVGVVLPGCKGEHFFHSNHLESFGWTYPRSFRDDMAFSWIMLVYPASYVSTWSDRLHIQNKCNSTEEKHKLNARLAFDTDAVQR